MALPSLLEELKLLDNWEDRYTAIIEAGQNLPPLPDEWRNDKNLVRGCMSQVWLVLKEQNGRLQLAGDSDALIVKGLVALFIALYDNKTKMEAKAIHPLKIFSDLGLLAHLSPTRRNGLTALKNFLSEWLKTDSL